MVATVPYPDIAVQVALQANPNSSDNPQWTDITELVIGAEALTRGHPYAVPQGQASTPTVTIRDPQELFNPANTGSPFVNGVGGRDVQPLRGAVWQAMHPRTSGATPILNANPYFESPTNASNWLAVNGAAIAAVNPGGAHQGTQSLRITPDGVTSGPASYSFDLIPCSAGTNISYGAWVWVTSTCNVIVGVQFNNSGGGFVGDSSTNKTVAATTWTYIAGSGSAPSNTNRIQLHVGMNGVQPAANVMYADEATCQVTPSVNLLNANAWRVPVDGSFESYPSTITPPWVLQYGSNTPTVTASSALSGARSLNWSVSAGGGPQGMGVQMQTIPGRFYRVQVLVSQGAANTVSLLIDGHNPMDSTAVGGGNTRVRLSGVFMADQPSHTVAVVLLSPSISSSCTIDQLMVEPITPVSPTMNFNGVNGGAGSLAGWRINNAGAAGSMSVELGKAGYHLRSAKIHPDPGGGLNVQFQSPEFAVLPNQQYWLNGAIQNNGIARDIAVWWYDSGHNEIASGFLTVTGGADWFLMDCKAFVSPAGAVFARVGTQIGGSASTIQDWWCDHVYLCSGIPQAFCTTGPVIYPVLRDSVERWPRRFESNGFEGYADLQLVDGLAALNAIKLHTEWAEAVLATNPDFYWRLNESGGTTFVDSSGHGAQPLIKVDGNQGAGPTFSPGAANDFPGNPGETGLSCTTTATSNVPASVAAAGAVSLGKPPLVIGGGSPVNISVSCWISHTALAAVGFGQFCWWIGNKDNSLNFELFGASGSPNQMRLGMVVPGGGAAVPVYPDVWADGKPHWFLCTANIVSGGTSTASLYIDGALAASATCATAAFSSLVGTTVEVGGFVDVLQNTGTPGGGIPGGVFSEMIVWNRILSGGEITDLYWAGQGYPFDTPSSRLTRHLTRGGYPSGNNNIPAPRFSTGRSILGASPVTERTPALQDAQNITLAEMGTLWIAPDGALVMESRDDRFLRVTPVMIFGEDFANGECPYQPNGKWDYDPLYIYADVQVQQYKGITAIGGRTADIAVAGQRFFGRSFTAGPLEIRDAPMVQDYADWVFYTHNVATQRIDSITIDPMSNPALWPFALAAEIGQRIRVRRRPQGLTGSLVYDQQYFIEQVSHSNINLDSSGDQPWSWKTTLSLTPAPATSQPWLLDDPTWSVLGSTTRLGF